MDARPPRITHLPAQLLTDRLVSRTFDDRLDVSHRFHVQKFRQSELARIPNTAGDLQPPLLRIDLRRARLVKDEEIFIWSERRQRFSEIEKLYARALRPKVHLELVVTLKRNPLLIAKGSGVHLSDGQTQKTFQILLSEFKLTPTDILARYL